jgi:hypothetical protein
MSPGARLRSSPPVTASLLAMRAEPAMVAKATLVFIATIAASRPPREG